MDDIAYSSGFSFDSKPVYFAFPDNVLDYDCSTCNAYCCRGNGFAANMAQELPLLIKQFPPLAYTASGLQGDWIHFSTLPGKCLLLNEAYFCMIEEQFGKSQKPGVCRAFPFNAIVNTGALFIIKPHFLCPMELFRSNTGNSAKGNHGTIFQELVETKLLQNEHMHQRSKLVEPVEEYLENEFQLRDVCSRKRGQSHLGQTLIAFSTDTKDLQGFLVRAEKLLGLDQQKKVPAEMMADFLLALAPVFSVSFLRLSFSSRLKALSLTETVLRTIFSLNEKVINLRNIAMAFNHIAPAIHLLAYDGMSLPFYSHNANHTIPYSLPAFSDLELTLAAAILTRLSHGGTPALEALEDAIPMKLPIIYRMIFLKKMGRSLEKHLQQNGE